MPSRSSELRDGAVRAMGIDFGRRRIGLAVSDPTRTIATPLETVVRRAGKRPPLARIERTAREWEVDHLVVGLPLDLSGEEGEWCAEVREMAGRLARSMQVGVSFVDERFTSVMAERALRDAGLPRGRRREKERVDAGAAQLILQRWLDAERRAG